MSIASKGVWTMREIELMNIHVGSKRPPRPTKRKMSIKADAVIVFTTD